jgi:hypothetical protein
MPAILTIFTGIEPGSPLEINGRFGGTYRIHLESTALIAPGSLIGLFFYF